MTEEISISVLTQYVVPRYNVLENIRSPRGVNMTIAYKAARIKETTIVDFNVAVEFPHAISLAFNFPLEPNTGLATLSSAGIRGITKGIMVATQKNVKPNTVPILISIGQEAQKGITVE